MKRRLNESNIKNLYEAILSIKNIEECSDFFEDLCTVIELKSMAQRLEVAKLLKQNVIYAEIGKETGASTATISRVSRSLNYGNDGYNKILERLNTDV